jgi:hypothetical protein
LKRLYTFGSTNEDFELQAFVFDDFAFLGNAFGEFAYQAGYASVFAYILSAV